MSSARRDDGSFRDPSGHVFHVDGRVFRSIAGEAADAYAALRDAGTYAKFEQAGFLIAADPVAPEDAGLPTATEARYVVEHPRLPYITYPYEWPFAALRAAALFHLDFQIRLLEDDVALSDASAYNIQFQGPKPIFIDLLSLQPYREGDYWIGHSQFCEQFLNPLLLRALLGVPYNSWYRGNLEGIPTDDLTRLVPLRSALSWRVLSHVLLPAWLQRSALKKGTDRGRIGAQKRRLPRNAYRGMLQQLRNWIDRLTPAKTRPTVWGDYASTHTYVGEEYAAKKRFVAEFASKTKPDLVLDLGCNTGDFSEIALGEGARSAVGFDFDQMALDGAFRRAVDRDLNFLPLYLDAANPSPDQGWGQRERRGHAGRFAAGAVFALAFEHHLAIGRNIPLSQVVEWIVGLAPAGVVEFVPKSDPTVIQMLALREDIFHDYGIESFERALAGQARIVRSEQVSATGRTLFWFDRGE